MIGNLLIDPVGYTAHNTLFRISVNEILAFLFHDRCLLFRHGSSNQVTPAHGISGQIPHDLHNLFLVDDTAVSRA